MAQLENLGNLITKATWGKLYAALPSRAAKRSFREQMKFTADITSDSQFRNMKNGYRKTSDDALKFINDYFKLSRT